MCESETAQSFGRSDLQTALPKIRRRDSRDWSVSGSIKPQPQSQPPSISTRVGTLRSVVLAAARSFALFASIASSSCSSPLTLSFTITHPFFLLFVDLHILAPLSLVSSKEQSPFRSRTPSFSSQQSRSSHLVPFVTGQLFNLDGSENHLTAHLISAAALPPRADDELTLRFRPSCMLSTTSLLHRSRTHPSSTPLISHGRRSEENVESRPRLQRMGACTNPARLFSPRARRPSRFDSFQQRRLTFGVVLAMARKCSPIPISGFRLRPFDQPAANRKLDEHRHGRLCDHRKGKHRHNTQARTLRRIRHPLPLRKAPKGSRRRNSFLFRRADQLEKHGPIRVSLFAWSCWRPISCHDHYKPRHHAPNSN